MLDNSYWSKLNIDWIVKLIHFHSIIKIMFHWFIDDQFFHEIIISWELFWCRFFSMTQKDNVLQERHSKDIKIGQRLMIHQELLISNFGLTLSFPIPMLKLHLKGQASNWSWVDSNSMYAIVDLKSLCDKALIWDNVQAHSLD